jgi:glycerol-3-phosphate acyltransferase PlsY
MILLSLLCATYLMGGFPTGLIVGKLFKGVDVRRYGSGNVGATNVLRVVGKLPGLLVLLVDTAKGWAPVTFFGSLASTSGMHPHPETARILLAVASVSGHIWNPFLQLQGGRGVATGLGVLLGLDNRVGLAVLGVWLVVVAVTRYVSVASITAALAAPFLMLFLGRPLSWVWGAIGIGLAIIARHRPNILRLLQGEEHRFGSFSVRKK